MRRRRARRWRRSKILAGAWQLLNDKLLPYNSCSMRHLLTDSKPSYLLTALSLLYFRTASMPQFLRLQDPS